jgi:two-component system nitrogen regulation sensor histidine kinase GlnL
VTDFGDAAEMEPHGSCGAHHRSFDLLSTAILIVGDAGNVVFANQAAEQLFGVSRRNLIGQPVARLFVDDGVAQRLLDEARANDLGAQRLLAELRRPLNEPLSVQVTATVLMDAAAPILLELTEIEEQLKVSREEARLYQTEANRELLRNLAHEVKNPLGGIRGAAQLLEAELESPEQREYTGVIISEADRLQSLVDRLFAPHRAPRTVAQFNPHEVCERVRTVILAEFPRGLTIVRDYDASMPDCRGDKEQLIQALLNIVRNAAQVLGPQIAAQTAEIVLRTRVGRHVAIARRHVKLALDLHVIDNGPGIPEELRDRVFFPLVSGREGGSGLGLSLAQSFVQQNDGLIEFESRPGHTDFRILLPLP